MYYVMRASAPSLHRESTDSLMRASAPSLHRESTDSLIMYIANQIALHGRLNL